MSDIFTPDFEEFSDSLKSESDIDTDSCDRLESVTLLKKESKDQPDLREQLFNQGEIGPVGLVSASIKAVGQIRGILIDIDLNLFQPDGVFSPVGLTSEEFYERHLINWLKNHPVLSQAEVRFTGSGFHVLLWFEEPLALQGFTDITRWSNLVDVVQVSLPSNPKQPGINALTWPVGSINSKNGLEVKQLKEGGFVTREEVMELASWIIAEPFAMTLKIWFGGEQVSPCPVCRHEGSYLEPSRSWYGRCYGECSLVRYDNMVQAILTNYHPQKKGNCNHDKKEK